VVASSSGANATSARAPAWTSTRLSASSKKDRDNAEAGTERTLPGTRPSCERQRREQFVEPKSPREVDPAPAAVPRSESRLVERVLEEEEAEPRRVAQPLW
jgi:hypothetical protein